MQSKEFFAALDELEQQRRIDRDTFIQSLESGLASAYKKEEAENKEAGDAFHVRIKLNYEKHEIKVVAFKRVIEDDEKEADGDICLSEAKKIKASAKVGDEIMTREIQSKQFSRIAAQTAKQVVTQRLNDAKKAQIFDEMNDKEGEILPAIIRKIEPNAVFVEIVSTQMEGIMGLTDQIKGEKYNVGDIIKVYVKKLKKSSYGNAQVMVSRANVNFVKRLFENEVPEIKSGVVVIKKIVREAGYRTKIAVSSTDLAVDPVGACIGPKGSRINAIVKELNGERIDVIEWSSDPLQYIANALSPAKAALVQVNDGAYSAKVFVKDDILSLAIGRDGQNARLAAKLTEWKIDVKPLSECDIIPEGDGDI
ncbi:MAG: transcription termination/antitermination protein NusA [Clostridia bacterium]|nr:transcription termination/antitermination protein NusA [Clostridia bacterium]